MSSRAWKVLPAVILFAVVSSQAQEKPEWQRRIDAWKLPPNPKFDAPLARATSKENACFDQSAMKAIASGLSDKDVTAMACKTCDGAITEYANVYLQANQHRYIGMTTDQAVAGERDQCLAFKSLRVSDLRYRYDHATVDRVSYGTFDAWHIEGRIARNGLLSYALSSQSSEGQLAIEMICYPANGHISEAILGPFTKSSTRSDVYVTYARDAEGMKQTVGLPDEGMIFVPGREGRDSLMSMAHWSKSVLRISIQGKTGTFSMPGYSGAFLDWFARCK